MDIVPVIGSKGVYEFHAPFTPFGLSTIVYECKKITKIKDMLDNGDDPKTRVYKRHAIEDHYQSHIESDMVIVTLVSSVDKRLEVPAAFIKTMPTNNGISYHNVVLGVSLGGLRVDYDYDTVIEEIKTTIKNNVGIEPSIRVMNNSPIALVNHDQHTITETQRGIVRAEQFNIRVRNELLQKENTKLKERLNILETHIKNQQEGS